MSDSDGELSSAKVKTPVIGPAYVMPFSDDYMKPCTPFLFFGQMHWLRELKFEDGCSDEAKIEARKTFATELLIANLVPFDRELSAKRVNISVGHRPTRISHAFVTMSDSHAARAALNKLCVGNAKSLRGSAVLRLTLPPELYGRLATPPKDSSDAAAAVNVIVSYASGPNANTLWVGRTQGVPAGAIFGFFSRFGRVEFIRRAVFEKGKNNDRTNGVPADLMDPVTDDRDSSMWAAWHVRFAMMAGAVRAYREHGMHSNNRNAKPAVIYGHELLVGFDRREQFASLAMIDPQSTPATGSRGEFSSHTDLRRNDDTVNNQQRQQRGDGAGGGGPPATSVARHLKVFGIRSLEAQGSVLRWLCARSKGSKPRLAGIIVEMADTQDCALAARELCKKSVNPDGELTQLDNEHKRQVERLHRDGKGPRYDHLHASTTCIEAQSPPRQSRDPQAVAGRSSAQSRDFDFEDTRQPAPKRQRCEDRSDNRGHSRGRGRSRSRSRSGGRRTQSFELNRRDCDRGFDNSQDRNRERDRSYNSVERRVQDRDGDRDRDRNIRAQNWTQGRGGDRRPDHRSTDERGSAEDRLGGPSARSGVGSTWAARGHRENDRGRMGAGSSQLGPRQTNTQMSPQSSASPERRGQYNYDIHHRQQQQQQLSPQEHFEYEQRRDMSVGNGGRGSAGGSGAGGGRVATGYDGHGRQHFEHDEFQPESYPSEHDPYVNQRLNPQNAFQSENYTSEPYTDRNHFVQDEFQPETYPQDPYAGQDSYAQDEFQPEAYPQDSYAGHDQYRREQPQYPQTQYRDEQFEPQRQSSYQSQRQHQYPENQQHLSRDRVYDEGGPSSARRADMRHESRPPQSAPNTKDTIEVSPSIIGLVVGSKGATMELLRQKSGARIIVNQRSRGTNGPQLIEIWGQPDSVREARKLIMDIVEGPLAKQATGSAVGR